MYTCINEILLLLYIASKHEFLIILTPYVSYEGPQTMLKKNSEFTDAHFNIHPRNHIVSLHYNQHYSISRTFDSPVVLFVDDVVLSDIGVTGVHVVYMFGQIDFILEGAITMRTRYW